MEGTYDIVLGGSSIGTVQVTKEGLYYRFRCRCRLSGEVMYKLTAQWDGHTESLGVPVPENGEFCLSVRLPIKRFGQEKPRFRAVPKHEPVSGRFVPISPEEPFRYLHRLNEAVFAVQDGQPGVILMPDEHRKSSHI